jgi:hypothetical protein
MNTQPENNHGHESPFSSCDCIDIELDGPEDTTVRPLTGDQLKRAIAERERIAHWESLGYGDSRDCVDFVIAGPEDTTVRPLTGELLKRAIAERESIAHWESLGYGRKSSKGNGTPTS